MYQISLCLINGRICENGGYQEKLSDDHLYLDGVIELVYEKKTGKDTGDLKLNLVTLTCWTYCWIFSIVVSLPALEVLRRRHWHVLLYEKIMRNMDGFTL